MTRKPAAGSRQIRCGVYTRKSTEEGLDQEFNSLDAQRESAEAYIASQKGEGWVCITERYDDGGFTGGNMDRPALKRLMADIEAGSIDVVVVYKVDRLSRSLLDFARMMEVFETKGVSFCSTTQQFNTTHSMGRLVLNVLMSFAEFERQIISERTRDKIAGARKKGKWAGGRPLLGYDLAGGRLTVNGEEAKQVREIFKIYLREQSLIRAAAAINSRGWSTKRWGTKSGSGVGGVPFHKSLLHKLLTNVAYLGKVRHREEVYDGEHAAIIDQATWDRVQAMLRVNGRAGGTEVRNKYGALLKGLLRCGCCDAPMTHSHTRKGSRCYRYYVCHAAMEKGRKACPSRSVPAEQIERFVVDRVKGLGRDGRLVTRVFDQARAQTAPGRRAVPRQQVEQQLVAFEPMWQSLSPKEQARALALIVERVEFDGRAGEVRVTFHPGAPGMAQAREAVA